jgi:predicted Zn-dependent protease
MDGSSAAPSHRERSPGCRAAPGVRIATAAMLALGLAVTAAPGDAQTIVNPELFGKSVAAAHQALEHYGRFDDAEALQRVADIGYRLAAHSGFTKYPFSFFLVDMREPNAFALPGGQIFLTRGMLELGLSDDQLAGLLGHEIAHVVLEHGIKMQRRATLLNVLSTAALVGVVLAEGGSGRAPNEPGYSRGPRESNPGERLQGAAAASVILGELLLRSYSREYEDQADEEGQRMAAAAGFAPAGTAELFDLMRSRIPQSKEYGYWRTHPFFTERVGAAEARGRLLRAQEPRPVERFRAGTQAVLLEFQPSPGKEPDRAGLTLFLEQAALTAWPLGEAADRLRQSSLERLRAAELQGPELSRDYGRVKRAYEEQRRQVVAIDPESPLLARLDADIAGLDEEVSRIYPQAVATLRGGVYQTPFLERFLSNFPAAPETPEVALALASAYSRLGRPAEAVERYLQAWRSGEEGDVGVQAIAGLRHLASSVDRLSALEQLAEIDDAELQGLTQQRLLELAGSFGELENGADYLRRFPQGARAEQVEARLDQLAERLYGEVILYQGIGDSMKALERIQKILTHAPLSSAAEKLRDRAVVEG